MYSNHVECRACGLGKPSIPTLKESCAAGPDAGPTSLVPVFDLGIQPLANDFTEANAEKAGYAPLKLMFCPRCTLAQLSVNVRPEILYRSYNYVTSPSETMRKHFETLAGDIRSETNGSAILEIGSNDGALLAYMRDNNKFMHLKGVDPAENLCKIAQGRGIDTTCDFFGMKTALELVEHFAPDVILARHVFCHVVNWHDFIKGIKILMMQETVAFIEVPYVGDLMQRGEFDTIYHEHLSYLSVTSIVALLQGTGLHLSRVIRYPIHGGAIMLVLRSDKSSKPPHISVQEFLNSEKQTMTLEAWKAFAVKATDQIGTLRAYVRSLVENGKRVVGYGASAKSTVWINACGFTRREIQYIVDETALKQWKQSPGSNIPIVDEGAILRDLPDYAIVFCWNFLEAVLEKNALARSKGVKFIVPVPKLETI